MCTENISTKISNRLIHDIAFMSSMTMSPDSIKLSKYFECKVVPPITIDAYINRFKTYIGDPDNLYVYIYIILQRFCTVSGIVLTNSNVYRLFAIAYVCCAKITSDNLLSMKYYAYISGISLVEINYLEKLFLNSIDWNLYVDPYQHKYVKDFIYSC